MTSMKAQRPALVFVVTCIATMIMTTRVVFGGGFQDAQRGPTRAVQSCLDLAGGDQIAVALQTCQALLEKAATVEDQSALHALIGALYFSRALARALPGATQDTLGQHLTPASRQDLEVSIEHYSNALRLVPGSTWALRNLFNRGYDKEVLGQQTEALKDYDGVLKLDPDFMPGHVYRARVLVALGRREEARAALNTALKLDPYHPAIIAAIKALGPPKSRSHQP